MLKILASYTNATCSRLSSLPFANGPKRSMGHVLGAEKGIFLIRGAEADEASANVAGGAFREARGYVPGPLF